MTREPIPVSAEQPGYEPSLPRPPIIKGPPTVERLRERVALCEESIHPASAWYREDIPALLAVVEAAQELRERYPATVACGHPEPREFCTPCRFKQALKSLHSQASDEGKP